MANWIVSGAGLTAFNGVYTQNGTYNGQPAYSLDANHWIVNHGSYWALSDSGQLLEYYYSANGSLPGLPWVVGGAGTAPFPLVSATYSAASPVATSFASSVTSMAVSMPATVNSGDRLIAVVSVRNAVTWNTIPTGFSQLKQQSGGGSVGQLTVFEKVADGSEGGTTKTWVASTGTTAQWQVIRVTGAHASIASEVASTSGDASSANPPSLSPTGGSNDYLWIAVASNSASGTTNTFSAAPTNYASFKNSGASSGGSSVDIATATYESTASSEDPGAFSVSNNRFWAAATVAIYPASGNVTTTQTITGLARIIATTLQTILGKARIQNSTTQTQPGKSRIQITTTQTITGKSRITATTAQTITGKARITAATTQTITGKAAVQNTTTQTISGKSRVQIATSQTITGVARITAAAAQTTTGVSRITVTTSRTTTGVARLTNTTLQTINGVSRIQITTQKTITGIANIATASTVTTKTITGKSRVTATTSQSITGKALILSTISKRGPDVIFLLDGRLATRIGNNVYMPL